MGSQMVTVKAIVIVTTSVALLLLLLLLKLNSVPLQGMFTVDILNTIPVPYNNNSSFLSWFKPPYLYLLINTIILSIAASYRFHHHNHHPASSSSSDHLPDPLIPDGPKFESDRFDAGFDVVQKSEFLDVAEEEEEKFVISKSEWVPPGRLTEEEMSKFVSEKPLVSARFAHRKPIRTTPEGGRALRVSKPKKQETLESTWKTITEGRAMPITRHLKKSETWEHLHHNNNGEGNGVESTLVTKSETFKDRTNYQMVSPAGKCGGSPSPALCKLRKEPSLSQDELNRRVEAFINKFNEEMRLQRQQSLNQYMEMVNRATH